MRTPRALLLQCKAIVGRRVRLTRTVRTRGGRVFRKGLIPLTPLTPQEAKP